MSSRELVAQGKAWAIQKKLNALNKLIARANSKRKRYIARLARLHEHVSGD